ncbi:MAG: CPXCG motif-containing cysteine-rich protein [Acidobacteriota bacterium]|nr:CPXCG motif-containing cysteine-rich protein [Acidobacteriota bacterium]MDH3528217.1 CPXCG motif-containing cysteine-rich protein [Acidobacteriota bacterium]
MEIEHFFNCPYCSASISMILDLSAGPQRYIEDCEVCCRPLEVSFAPGESEIESFYVIPVEQ